MSLLLGLLEALGELVGGIACALLVAMLCWRGFRRFGHQQWGPAAGFLILVLLVLAAPIRLGHFSTVLLLFSALFALGAFTIAPHSNQVAGRADRSRHHERQHIFR